MRVSPEEESNDNRTIYCGNLSENVTDGVLFELFQQAGPVESVRRPRDPNGRPKSFAFVVYKHECSIPYALEIFRGIKLFNRIINLNSRSTLRHIPVLDTHITEFTQPRSHVEYEEVHVQETEPRRRYQERERSRSDRNEEVYVQESESRRYQGMEDNRRERNRSDSRRHDDNRSRYSRREKDANEPTSWAELNALRGKNFAHGNSRSDLQGISEGQRDLSNGSQIMPDFNSLLQMGQQMLLTSGLMGVGGFPFPNMMPVMGGPGPVNPGFGGNNMLPIVPGVMEGSGRHSPERDRERRDNHSRRESRREHPYSEHYDHRDNHRRHDRGYSSSHSSHDRERRDRRSR